MNVPLVLLAACLSGALAACPRGHDDGATPQREVGLATSPAPAPSSSAAPALSSAAPVPSAPELVPVPFAPATGLSVFNRIDGALAVASNAKVGRIADGRIEWAPGEIKGFSDGALRITDVYGRWPDAVDVVYVNGNPRIPSPTYAALNRKGDSAVAAGGGGQGHISGAARVGESVVVSTYSELEGHLVVTVRGPRLARFVTKASACKASVPRQHDTTPAVVPWAFEATPAGTLLALGQHCEQGFAVEVWDPGGKVSVLPVGAPKRGDQRGGVAIVPGRGDEAFLLVDGMIYRYETGKVDGLAGPGPYVRNIFRSGGGVLHANAGRALYRLERGAWELAGRLAFPRTYPFITEWEGAYWVLDEGIRKLEPGEGFAYRQGCKTPFVHLSDVSPNAPPRYAFPATQKVLAAFPGVNDLSLVEFWQGGSRRLGAAVKDAAQGEALVAHVRAKVKEDDPTLLCFSPSAARAIPIAAKP